jgi:cobyrinic acid a,c-diamide synthase
MQPSPPRLMVAALRGGSGKTILSLGLTAAWTAEGKRVAAFKKGPDFIDPGWLSLAAGRPCRNLDPFMMDESQNLETFFRHTMGADAALIEGNRGLFDGLDLEGCCSSAELARCLRCPTVLIVDVTMTTRTIAALVMGCQAFDPHLDLRGVILNRVGGPRQESVVRSAVEHYCGVPVLGSVRRLRNNRFPERHMGLIPHQERARAEEAITWARDVARESLDLDALWAAALDAPTLEAPAGRSSSTAEKARPAHDAPPRIGFLLDSAFWFYYPENLSALEEAGAVLVKVNALDDPRLPELDGLYIGGGFPETQAEGLAANRGFREDLRERIEAGLPVYAECGGLMYLGEHLVVEGNAYPMVGALPVDFVLERKPQGHGYTRLEVTGENPFYERGACLKGHEFHYSRPVFRSRENVRSVFRLDRGRGIDGETDGLCRYNLLGTYTHIHAVGTPSWAESLARKAAEHRDIHGSKISSDFQKRD